MTDLADDRRIPSYAGAGNLVYREPDVPRFVSGSGSWLTAHDGRRYLDAEAANGTVAFGYDATLLQEAMRRCEQLPALPSFAESELRLKVLSRLEPLVSDVLGTPGRVELDLGGAQAMETALRIAFAANGPGTIVVFEGAFHGRSGVTSMLSSSPRYRELLAAWGLEVVRLPSPDSQRCPHAVAGGGCGPGCREAVTRWGSELSGVGGRDFGRKVSAFVFESVQGSDPRGARHRVPGSGVGADDSRVRIPARPGACGVAVGDTVWCNSPGREGRRAATAYLGLFTHGPRATSAAP